MSFASSLCSYHAVTFGDTCEGVLAGLGAGPKLAWAHEPLSIVLSNGASPQIHMPAHTTYSLQFHKVQPIVLRETTPK